MVVYLHPTVLQYSSSESLIHVDNEKVPSTAIWGKILLLQLSIHILLLGSRGHIGRVIFLFLSHVHL